MTVNKYLMPVLVLAALFSSVLVAKVTGVWSVSGKQLLDVQQLSSGDDVRGWMTFQDLSDGYGIPQDTLYALLGVPLDVPAGTALKDMESVLPGFEVSVVREVINSYLQQGQPLDMESDPEPSGTPVPPVAGEPSGGIFESAGGQQQPADAFDQPADGPGSPLEDSSDGVLPGAEIKGRNTLQEIVDQCHIPEADLIRTLNLPPDVDRNTMLKDLAAQGLLVDVESVKDLVTSLQNR